MREAGKREQGGGKEGQGVEKLGNEVCRSRWGVRWGRRLGGFRCY